MCISETCGPEHQREYRRQTRAVHRRPTDLAGPCFLRYSLADGTCPWEYVGDDLAEAIAARERKPAHFEEDTFNISIKETFAQDSLTNHARRSEENNFHLTPSLVPACAEPFVFLRGDQRHSG